jgi:hypothetical protein
MRNPYRRQNWLLRQAKAHRITFVVAAVCAVVVFVAVAAVTGFFGLAHTSPGSSSPPGSALNPYNETILAIESAVTYTGSDHDYFLSLDGQNLCADVCPILPKVYPAFSPPEIGVYFYVNVTNTASNPEKLYMPTIGTSGPDGSLFTIQVFCCYTTTGTLYSEPIGAFLSFTAGQAIGIAGYAYTTDPIPYSPSGGYTLYVNSTSD